VATEFSSEILQLPTASSIRSRLTNTYGVSGKNDVLDNTNVANSLNADFEIYQALFDGLTKCIA